MADNAEGSDASTAARRTTLIRQIYGYAVCLTSVVVLLFSSASVLDSIIEYANPEHSRNVYGAGSSFDAYLAMQRDRTLPAAAPPDTTSVETQRARWMALREANAAQVRFDSFRSLARNALLVVLALVLFITHWRWLRTVERRA